MKCSENECTPQGICTYRDVVTFRYKKYRNPVTCLVNDPQLKPKTDNPLCRHLKHILPAAINKAM
jgi:hypothetical protein